MPVKDQRDRAEDRRLMLVHRAALVDAVDRNRILQMWAIPDRNDDGDDGSSQQQVQYGAAVAPYQNSQADVSGREDEEEAKGLLGPEAQAGGDSEPHGITARFEAVSFD